MTKEYDYEKVRRDLVMLAGEDIPRSCLIQAMRELTRDQVRFTALFNKPAQELSHQL